jgi:hypothetical protein
MRHTVNASTGMPRRDLSLVFGFGGGTPEQRLAEMRSMAPTTGLGEVFQYSNHLVALCGYVAAKHAFPDSDPSSAYDRAMRELVFAGVATGTIYRRFTDKEALIEAAFLRLLESSQEASRAALTPERLHGGLSHSAETEVTASKTGWRPRRRSARSQRQVTNLQTSLSAAPLVSAAVGEVAAHDLSKPRSPSIQRGVPMPPESSPDLPQAPRGDLH